MGQNFFNLPSPWNPGYALPANVEAEGLRRATLVTGEPARGTYFDGRPLPNGYVVPGFIEGEVPNEARVTQWSPRGTYVGGRIISSPPASAAGSPITKYGQKAAAHLVATVKQLPPNQRGPALKVVLNRVDPSLWRRAGQHAMVLRSRGATADTALKDGLAKAMSEGVLTELVQVGQRRARPAPRSQLGLGCYGCAAVLGDVLEEFGLGTDYRDGGATTGVRVDGSTGRVAPAPVGEKLQFGPFLFGAQGQRIRVHSATALPPAWRTWFPAELKRLGEPGDLMAYPKNIGVESIFPGVWKPTDRIPVKYVDGSTPVFKGTHPTTKRPMGVFLRVVSDGSGWMLEAWYRDVDLLKEKSRWGKAWDKIKTVAAKVVHAVAKAGKAAADFAAKGLDKMKDLACEMVNNPATAGAAALAAGPAGAVGVGLSQGICSPEETAQPMVATATPGPPNLLLPLAIGGGLLALLLLK